MESINPTTEIMHDFSPRFVVYKDGRVKRLVPQETVPPSFDPKTRVRSKDVTISPNLSARLYLPEPENTTSEITKMPLLIYFHGGAFCLFSAKSTVMHNYLNSLVSKANVVALSVDYRLAPEYPVPACYEDAWEAVQWAASHANGTGPDPCLNHQVDFKQVYLGGESAGANISHNILDRVESGGLLPPGVAITNVVMVHPFFGDGKPFQLWNFVCPSSTGVDDPRLNPMADPARMKQAVGCRRVLLCVDKDDSLRDVGVKYVETLKKSGWEGDLELVETNGGGHVFQLWHLDSDEAVALVTKIASFITTTKSC